MEARSPRASARTLRRIEALLAAGEPRQAMDLLAPLLARRPGDVDLELLKGRIWRRMGVEEQMLRALMLASRERPLDPEPCWQLSLHAIDRARRRAHLEEALRRDPHFLPGRAGLLALEIEESPGKAETRTLLEGLLLESPSSPELLFQQACLALSGAANDSDPRLEAGISLLEDVVSRSPGSLRPRLRLARVLLEGKMTARAREVIEEIRYLAPSLPEGWLLEVRLQAACGGHRVALRTIAEARRRGIAAGELDSMEIEALLDLERWGEAQDAIARLAALPGRIPEERLAGLAAELAWRQRDRDGLAAAVRRWPPGAASPTLRLFRARLSYLEGDLQRLEAELGELSGPERTRELEEYRTILHENRNRERGRRFFSSVLALLLVAVALGGVAILILRRARARGPARGDEGR
ncbi:MAG: tetratricopeptide repeat protein [Planctomycetota bacterium]